MSPAGNGWARVTVKRSSTCSKAISVGVSYGKLLLADLNHRQDPEPEIGVQVTVASPSAMAVEGRSSPNPRGSASGGSTSTSMS